MSSEQYELQYIKEAFKTNWIATLVKNVDEFENFKIIDQPILIQDILGDVLFSPYLFSANCRVS